MGLFVVPVNVTANEVVYLITNQLGGEGGGALGTNVIITMIGVASPLLAQCDLATDVTKTTWGRAASARFRQAARAGLDGLGDVAASAWTQAQARDLFSISGATQAGSPLMPRMELALQPVAGVDGGPLCEADVDVDAGVPFINITAAAVAGRCILRVRLRSTPGIR